MADPVISLHGLIYAGITLGAVIAGYKAQGLRRNSNNRNKPLTEEKHELICRANTAELFNDVKAHISEEVGKLYEAIKEVTR